MPKIIGKKPLQAVLVAPEWHEMVEAGEKTFTVREGKRLYETGSAVLCCDEVSWCVPIQIKSVDHCVVRDVPEHVIKNEGFVDRKALLTKLQEYYPNMTWGSLVTVIGW